MSCVLITETWPLETWSFSNMNGDKWNQPMGIVPERLIYSTQVTCWAAPLHQSEVSELSGFYIRSPLYILQENDDAYSGMSVLKVWTESEFLQDCVRISSSLVG